MVPCAASGTMPVFSRPSAQQFSSVNFAANTPANPNLAVVTIGSDGQFCYDGAVSDHHVILDLVGIVPGANINAIDPTRILDTRSGAKLNANSSRCVAAPGGSAGDVAVVNITNTAATGGGYGAVRASGTMPVFSRPSAQQFSSVNFAANTPANPNLAVVTIGSDGQFCYDGAVSDHHVILDLVGIVPGANINAIDPTRILDTRSEADPPRPCDPSYPSICIPPPPPQLSCDDVGAKTSLCRVPIRTTSTQTATGWAASLLLLQTHRPLSRRRPSHLPTLVQGAVRRTRMCASPRDRRT